MSPRWNDAKVGPTSLPEGLEARVALLEQRVERLEQTVRAHAVVSDARWARRSVTRSVPGRMSFTVLEKKD